MRESRHGQCERDERCRGERPSHRAPASGERCPKIGATFRSQKSRNANTTIVSAKPALKAGEVGRAARPRQTNAPTSAVQPSAWCRNAAREKSQGFCSWIRNAVPETSSANGSVSSHHGL